MKRSKFPLDCKIAKLKPLYKKGSKTDPKNYRPVSLLPLVSKVIETFIHNQTEIFLNKNKILYKYQSGFRKSFSTNSCLTLLTDKINKGFESGKYTGLILIDLQKAFDTIDHEILLKKMGCIGFSEKVISWFESYLSGRTFKVNIDKKFSDPGNLTCGVPQGSILGPLLFLLYVNDMPQAVKCDLFLYADDTCLTFQHENVKEIEDQLNLNFSRLCDWFIDNKLSIHLGEDKTKSILFGTKLNIKRAEPLNIVYGNVKIKQYTKVTYLGCILDESLSGESMALHVLNKINSRLRFLYRQNRFLNKPLRRLLCNAMIQPFFDYACPAWYPSLRKDLQKRLQVSQNNCVRFCLQLDKKTRIGVAEFKEINWLNINDIFSQCVLSSIYTFFNSESLEYFNEIYFLAEPSNINTRSSFQSLKQPLRKSNKGLNNASYSGPSLWNKLPIEIKRPGSTNSFKHNVKNHYLTKMEHTGLLISS